MKADQIQLWFLLKSLRTVKASLRVLEIGIIILLQRTGGMPVTILNFADAGALE